MLVTGHCYSGFRLEELVGITPVAHLWRATDIRRGSVRGIRVLAPEAAPYQSAFLESVTAQRILTHPNRVALLDVIEVDGSPALVTEHIAGPSLQTWMRIRQRTTDEILAVFQEIVGAVGSAHSLDLWHLHLEPSQIWMHTRRGSFVPKIDLAFGPMAVAGLRLGRVRAPEQALGQRVDARSDLFLLGTVLYELLAGRPPFDESHARLHPMIAAGSYRPLGDLRSDLPPLIFDLVDRLLAPAIEDRPASVEEVLSILVQGSDSEDASTASDTPATVVPIPVPKTEPAWSSAVPTVTPEVDDRSVTDRSGLVLVPARPPSPPPTRPAWTHPVAVASMVAAGLLSLAGALIIVLGS